MNITVSKKTKIYNGSAVPEITVFCGIRMFIALTVPYPEPVESTPSSHTLFLQEFVAIEFSHCLVLAKESVQVPL